MTITDIIPLRDNKYFCFCDQHERELKIIEDQITCLQKSVANLRKDMPELVTKRIQEMGGRKKKLYHLEDKQ
jgi:hypothetical protein